MLRANKYPGTCLVCGRRVESYGGVITKLKMDPKKWRTRHNNCPRDPNELDEQPDLPPAAQQAVDIIATSPTGISILNLAELFKDELTQEPPVFPRGAADDADISDNDDDITAAVDALTQAEQTVTEIEQDMQIKTSEAELEASEQQRIWWEQFYFDSDYADHVENPTEDKWDANSRHGLWLMIRFLGESAVTPLFFSNKKYTYGIRDWLAALNGYVAQPLKSVPDHCRAKLVRAILVMLHALHDAQPLASKKLHELNRDERRSIIYTGVDIAYLTLDLDWSPFIDCTLDDYQRDFPVEPIDSLPGIKR